MGRPVNVLLMYWALDAFRADRIDKDHGLAYDAARPRFNEPVERVGAIPWLETFRQAKEIGEVNVLACSGSLEVLGIDAAIERIEAHGGQARMGPDEVPGGSWIVQALDPQGAAFALVSSTR